MPAVPAIIIGAITAGSAGYNAYTASQNKSQAIDEKGRQEKLAEKAANDMKTQMDKERTDQAAIVAAADAKEASNAMRIAQQRRRQIYSLGNMKGGTLVTGPLGIVDPPKTSGKTLLGT